MQQLANHALTIINSWTVNVIHTVQKEPLKEMENVYIALMKTATTVIQTTYQNVIFAQVNLNYTTNNVLLNVHHIITYIKILIPKNAKDAQITAILAMVVNARNAFLDSTSKKEQTTVFVASYLI